MPARIVFLLVVVLSFTSSNVVAFDPLSSLANGSYIDVVSTSWIHGSKNCKKDTNPPIQVIQANESSYVLRQNKCLTFEAPFIYVLFGRDKVLVIDSGAIDSSVKSPIYQTVASLIAQRQRLLTSPEPNILLVHTHSHSDHTKGDVQFESKQRVEVVATSNQALESQLGLSDWPNAKSTIDLGGRKVTIIPVPGHQEQSIAIYDEQTGWLITGDTLYPGEIRVKNWSAYRDSIKRLFEFSQTHVVSHVLGAHIETNAETGKIYRIGNTYQPQEAPLGLSVSQLEFLHEELQKTSNAKKLKFKSFTISPLSRFEKFLSNTLSK
jgi:glyoxylase-like metal-dependent hydrolase (beta-lactamase superfamily II)